MSELFYLPFPTAFSSNGLPVPGAKAFFYLSGTSTPQAIYSDSALTIERTNPVIANSAGRFPETYLDTSKVYRVVVLDSEGGSLNIDIDPYFAGATAITEFMFIQSGTGATPLDSQSKMRQVRAVGDFTTPAVADANNETLFVPADAVSTVATGAALAANYWGPGQIETANGNKRGKWFSNVTAAPASTGDHDSIETAFNGDLSHSIFQIEGRITGAGTLGTPATGYLYTPEVYPFYGMLYNSSGHNEETDGNGGRTGAAFMRVGVKQYGQGDLACYNATAFVASTKSGSTDFLANPAVILFNGDMSAGIDGAYLNPREIICRDQGYDVACIGDVVNLVRTNNTGAKGVWWSAYRAQNQGTEAPDNVLSAAGVWNAGLDFSMTDFGANEGAIALAAGQRIYFSASSSNGKFADALSDNWLEYSPGLSGFVMALGGSGVFQFTAAQLSVVGARIVGTGGMSLTGLGNYANDAAASGGGVPVNGFYRNGSVLMVRVV